MELKLYNYAAAVVENVNGKWWLVSRDAKGRRETDGPYSTENYAVEELVCALLETMESDLPAGAACADRMQSIMDKYPEYARYRQEVANWQPGFSVAPEGFDESFDDAS